jgi:tetratricopeptide (TPR) repeat protein
VIETPPPKTGAGRGITGRRVVAIVALVLFATCAAGASVSYLRSRRRPDPERLWMQAEVAFRLGRRDEARALLEQIARLRPKSVHDLLLEAQLASAEERIDDAIGILDRVPEEHELFGQAALMAGRLERERNRVRMAETHFRRAVRVQPGLVEAHKELIYIYGVQLRRREVDAEFHALARLTRLNHHDLFTWALTHFTTWNPDVARDLQSFVDADPKDRHSRLALAEILLDQPGEDERVSRLLDAFPSTDPEALAIRVGLALHLGRVEEARSLLERAPKDHPGLARYRGRLAMLRKDPGAAVEQYRIALSAEPYDRVSTFDLGQALAVKGDKAGADVYLTRAKRLNELYNLVMIVRSPERENRAPDLAKLGASCEAAGLVEEASHWYALAIDSDPLNTSVQQALFRLRSASAHN